MSKNREINKQNDLPENGLIKKRSGQYQGIRICCFQGERERERERFFSLSGGFVTKQIKGCQVS